MNKLLEAFSVLALHEICSYIDINGSPVFCDYETYISRKNTSEFNKFWLTEEQFNTIVDYFKSKEC